MKEAMKTVYEPRKVMNYSRQIWTVIGNSQWRGRYTYPGTAGEDSPWAYCPTEKHTDDLTSNDVDPLREYSCPITSEGYRIGEKVRSDRAETLHDTEKSKSDSPVCSKVAFEDKVTDIPGVPGSHLGCVSCR